MSCHRVCICVACLCCYVVNTYLFIQRPNMEQAATPILTEKQQRFALSGKKNKKRDKRGHIVFASPYDPYWPVLGEGEEADLNQLLLSVLQPVKKPAVRVNWSELRRVPRKQRREMRLKMQQELDVDVSSDRSDELRQCLFLGVNAVTRGLESMSVGCVLLAQDADPKMLISHIPTMCGMQGVPILIMSSLRSIVSTALGFSCIAVGFKKSAVESEGSHFYALCKAVSELCEKIPVPEPLPAFCCALSQGPGDSEAKEPPSKPQPSEVKVSVDVYKYRCSNKERAFIPGVATAPKPSLDFLSLHMDTATNSNIKTLVQDGREAKGTQILRKQTEFHYQPLRLKQTVPNPKKIRKKELKKKRQ